jgi:anti-sigma regulatory factor (Ser/Thr protein kinase)
MRDSRTLPGLPESARAAREFTAACLPGCPSVYEAMLCADELVANAIQHSRSGLPGGTVTVTVITQPGRPPGLVHDGVGPARRGLRAGAAAAGTDPW